MTDLKRPVKRVARGLAVPHGVNPDLVISLYPGGVIGLREARRRKEVKVSALTLYTRALRDEARARRPRKP